MTTIAGRCKRQEAEPCGLNHENKLKTDGQGRKFTACIRCGNCNVC